MVNKRKRSFKQETSQKPNKRLSNRKKKQAKIVPAENRYTPLTSEDDNREALSQDQLIDNNASDYSDDDDDDGNDIVIQSTDDEDSEDVVIESDEEKSDKEKSDEEESEEPKQKSRKIESNELSKNSDFIGLGFESSEDEKNSDDYDDYSDDGIISNDEGQMNVNASPTTLYPWIKAHDHSKQKEIADWLTMEIKDFVNYISPSKEEIMTRNSVIKRLKLRITGFWKNTETHVFGSNATDLYLPGSDIDMVVVSDTGEYENRSKLYQLSSFFRNNKLAKDIEVIAGAKVPIIKFSDPQTNINIDISFERVNGIEAAKKIRKWLSTTPGLRELVLVVKQFLRSRKLNNVHVGGLGGYSTIILCYHFLKLHPRLLSNNMRAMDNLGSLLIEFFELYGRNFSYDNLIISIDPITDLPKYLKKFDHPALSATRNPFSIIVQDPSDPNNNITRSSYNLRDIKKAFGGAFQLLTDKCYSLNAASYKKRIGQLILGDIIKFKGKERDFNDERNLVINTALVKDDDENQPAEIEESLELGNENKQAFYSDVTVESDDDTDFGNDQNKNQSKGSVADYLGIENGEENSEEHNEEHNEDHNEDEKEEKKKKSSLQKDVKRDYWKQKGLEL